MHTTTSYVVLSYAYDNNIPKNDTVYAYSR